MTDSQQRNAAREFAEHWRGKGYEKGESQLFWISLLKNVFGIEHPEKFIRFEEQVKLDHTSFIDGYIGSTKVMIEQKGSGKDLRKPIRQSDGSFLTPFRQAKRYASELPYSQRPRWIITCNFNEFLIYDMERPQEEPESLLTENLEREYYRLAFLTDNSIERIRKEMEVSLKAGQLVGKLYDILLEQYNDRESPETLKSLNILCVRLVFCFYAEDAGLFGKHDIFLNYLKEFPANKVRSGLIELFRTLDTPVDERDEYMDEHLAAFPYVNGGLFADETIEIPRFTDDIIDLIENECCEDFDWSSISPTIFGAVFESTLNPHTRRSGGMHYTSIENIHKVIDPLFLDSLQSEFREICNIRTARSRDTRLKELQTRMASLKFLDPACGSGNFLTETFISLRRLENDILRILNTDGLTALNFGEEFSPIKVSLNQFYGIEINDFAVTVAKTALWISEAQMQKETEDIIARPLDFFPLKSYSNIIEADALKVPWDEFPVQEEPVTDIKVRFDYIMGNPPFVGYAYQSKEQKEGISLVWGNKVKNLDYVSCWYKKAAETIQRIETHCAFVSTNSITQGEQTAIIWKPLMEKYHIHIDFAYRTFRWDSESNQKAHVHCVIIAFSTGKEPKEKIIYNADGTITIAKNINAYLMDAENVFIGKRTKPLYKEVAEIFRGSQPTDNGNLILTEEEKDELIKKEPYSEKFIRPFMMGKDFIDRKPRFCLWFVGTSPSDIRRCPSVMRRIESVRNFRLRSTKESTRAKAETPMLFDEIRTSSSRYIAIPKVSSEKRKYIPIDYLAEDIVAGDKLFIMPDASIYSFGILTSRIHNAWMRAVCGRLKSDYSYSNTIVYNNFPWPAPTDRQQENIEKSAKAILDARALYPDSSLADLYDELTMPVELRKAHQANDIAVMEAYGFPTKDFSEDDCVAALMKMYKELSKQ